MRRAVAFMMLMLFASCSKGILYTGSHALDGNTYTNNDLKFTLAFAPKWKVWHDRSDKNGPFYDDFYYKDGDEAIPLLYGKYNDIVFVRCLAEQVDVEPYQYVTLLEDANKEDIESSQFQPDTVNQVPAIRWYYTSTVAETSLKYKEILFASNGYMIRLSFYTTTNTFGESEKYFDEAIQSLKLL